MGRVKVHYFENQQEYNDGGYDYPEVPEFWSGSPIDLINYIAKKSSSLQKLVTTKTCYNNTEYDNFVIYKDPYQLGHNEKIDKNLCTEYDNFVICNGQIERKAKIIGFFALILAECPSDCKFIVIRND